MPGVRFRSIGPPPGVRIADAGGQRRTDLRFEEARSWNRTGPNGFPFHVTDAIETTLSGFELKPTSRVYVRDTTGLPHLSVTPGDSFRLPEADYCLELCTPVKVYVTFAGSGRVAASTEAISVQFDRPVAVAIGSRSSRSTPTGTITTTSDPEDLMTAVSCFGGAMRADSPSRSYPTMRGYPPLLENGSELSVPPSVTRDDSGVRLEIPPTLEFVLPSVSFAYYTGATLRPGAEPRVVVDGEPIYELSRERYQTALERLLQRVFFLDCLTRTVGHYPMETQSFSRLAAQLPFDVSECYDADIGTRLERYRAVSFETLRPELPTWDVTAHVEPVAASISSLPHLAYQLAFVRTESPGRLSGPQAREECLTSFTEHYGTGPTRVAQDVFGSEAAFVDVPPSGATGEDVWVGDDIPLRGNKFLHEGYENRLGRAPVERTSISVGIVCNEPWMDGEAAVSQSRYGNRDELPFEVEVYPSLSRAEFRRVLETDRDFLHYIGHANGNGLECRDGYLDVASVDDIGADMFFFNACQSYRPGVEMVRNGCIGGIVTLSDVTDSEADTIGCTVARLLNLGFSVRHALAIARRRSIVGGQYLAVGDDSTPVVQAESTVPYECSVRRSEEGYELTLRAFPSGNRGPGPLFVPYVGPDEQRYLAGRSIGPLELSAAELGSFLELENAPVWFEGEFYWAFELRPELA
jgi:hypothetical protein